MAPANRRSGLAINLEYDRHFEKTAKARPPAAQRRAGKLVSGEAREKPADRRLALQTREMVADALMRAAGKGKMAVRRAADVEALGVGKLRRMPLYSGKHSAPWKFFIFSFVIAG